jgi:hypothetical protein
VGGSNYASVPGGQAHNVTICRAGGAPIRTRYPAGPGTVSELTVEVPRPDPRRPYPPNSTAATVPRATDLAVMSAPQQHHGYPPYPGILRLHGMADQQQRTHGHRQEGGPDLLGIFQ